MDSGVNPPKFCRKPRKRNRVRGREEEFRSSTPNQEADPSLSPNFPDEIIFEILSRLPAKSLGKFKCVSKPWLSLISSPHFVKTHVAIASRRAADFGHQNLIFEYLKIGSCETQMKQCSLSSVLYPWDAATANRNTTTTATLQLSNINLPKNINGKNFTFRGSCNGLFCISARRKDVFLWNPCFSECRKLPVIDLEKKREYAMTYGFGFDEFNDDYKVLCFSTEIRRVCNVTEVRVYSLKYDCWRRHEDCKRVNLPLDYGQYANGSLHWPAMRKGDVWWKFLSFDLTKETFGELEFPCVRQCYYWNVGVLGGCLSVVFNCDGCVDVWVMKKYGIKESWTKIVSFSISRLPNELGFSFPLCLSRNGDILLVIRRRLVLYSPKSNTCRWHPCKKELMQVGMSVESLVSPYLYREQGNSGVARKIR